MYTETTKELIDGKDVFSELNLVDTTLEFKIISVLELKINGDK